MKVRTPASNLREAYWKVLSAMARKWGVCTEEWRKRLALGPQYCWGCLRNPLQFKENSVFRGLFSFQCKILSRYHMLWTPKNKYGSSLLPKTMHGPGTKKGGGALMPYMPVYCFSHKSQVTVTYHAPLLLTGCEVPYRPNLRCNFNHVRNPMDLISYKH